MEKNKFEIVTSTGEKLLLTKPIIQKYITKGQEISDEEFNAFFQLCKVRKLNPFLGEAYLIKYGSQPAQIVTDYKVFQQRADNNPNYNGMRKGVVVINKNGDIIERVGQAIAPNEEIIGGWAEIHFKCGKIPTKTTVNFEEFAGKKKDGELNSQWKTKPCFMIEKVAKTHALREAFPNEYTGMYIQEEMPQNHDEPNRVVNNDIVQEYNDIDFNEVEEAEIIESDVNQNQHFDSGDFNDL